MMKKLSIPTGEFEVFTSADKAMDYVAKKGVPILFFYDGMLKADYHKPTDTVDKINFDLYEKRVRMIFYTAWEIANRNDMLKRDIPLIDIDE